MNNISAVHSTSVLLLLALFGAVVAGCASDVVPEPEGSTDSALSGGQWQPRMRQARRILRTAASFLDSASPAQPTIAEALTEIQAGIDFDNSHVSAKEDQRLENAANVAVKTTLAQCGSNADCLLDGAHAKLKAATIDKGGHRAAAMKIIEEARTVLATPPPVAAAPLPPQEHDHADSSGR